jgi:DNA-binding MarR family transcriptional regulator
MTNITMMQVLVLRAIHGMPAGASAEAIYTGVRGDTGVHIYHGTSTLRALLEKRYIQERRIPTVRRMRHEPICYYSLTPAGRAILRERSVVRMQVASRTQAPAPGTAQVVMVSLGKTHERLPQHRPATARECKAAGLPLWKNYKNQRDRREARCG